MQKELVRLITRWKVPALIVGLTLLVIAYFHLTQSSFRYYAYVFGPIVGLLGLWSWYVRSSGLSEEQRKGLVRRTQLIVGGVLLLAVLLLKPDGSWKGTSLIKFTWRWTPQPDQNLESLETASETPPPEELIPGFHVDWPNYLGPNRDGTLLGVHLKRDWKAHPPTLLWRQPIGLGWGSFAVQGRRALTMEQRGEEELVTCYDLLTGTPLWTQATRLRFEGPMGGAGPRSTPTISEGRVYAQSAGGALLCLELETGKLIWKRDVLNELGLENLKYGKSNAPLIVDDKVIVSTGITGPVLAAYHRDTGEPIWTAENGQASYATPILATLSGRTQLISVNGLSVSGHDPESGAQFWRWSWDQDWPKAGQPHVIGGDQLFLTASYGQGSYLLDMEGAEPEVIWRNLRMKTKFSSAVVRDGFAYGLDEGILACIEVETGKRQWKGGRYGFGQNILVDDLLIVQAEDGYVTLVEASPEDFVEVAKLDDALQGTTWNVPALVGSYLLIRNSAQAACFQLACDPET